MTWQRNRVLIVAVGNSLRRDDGLAPKLLEILRQIGLDDHWWLTMVEDAQLQIEHALDLQLSDIALFVNTSGETRSPYSLEEIETPEGHRMVTMSHDLDPQDVMHTLKTIGRRDVPPCFLLTLAGEQFGLGEGLSTTAAQNLEAAKALLEKLLEEPTAEAWRAGIEGQQSQAN